MIVNGKHLLALQPILEMESSKKRVHGTSYGLAEAGYDIRIKQQVEFFPTGTAAYIPVREGTSDGDSKLGFTRRIMTEPTIMVMDPVDRSFNVAEGARFTLASAIEEFRMPNNLVGIVHDKSTWARKGLSVFNTVIEPGWNGFLTLELVFHGNEVLIIPAGSGIAQVLFHELQSPGAYEGKYQNQKDEPVHAKFDP